MPDTVDSHRAPALRHVFVDSIRHPAAQRVRDVLRSRAAHPRTIVIDDDENIAQAQRNGVLIDSLYVTTDLAEERLPQFGTAGPAGQPAYALAPDVTAELFGRERLSRVFALARAPRPARFDDLTSRGGDVVVLDGVRLAGNIGAIIRTAAAFDAAGVILIDSGLRTVLDRRVIRASRGLVFAVPVPMMSRTAFLDDAHRRGITVCALTAEGSEALSSLRRVAGPLALVLGSEREGVSALLETSAARRYAIGMSPRVESLNVSVAAAIALHERNRRAR